MTEYSLKLSGVIDGTRLFVNTGPFPDYKSYSDLRTVVDFFLKNIQKNQEHRVNIMNLKCKEDFDYGFSLISDSASNIYWILRFFLNTQDKGTIGRTYLPLHKIELAKVKIINSNKIKIIKRTSNEEIESKLYTLYPFPPELLNSVVFM